MARYLSDEWFDAVADALGADGSDDGGAEGDLVIGQRVEGVPAGWSDWHLLICGTDLALRRGPHPAPTVTFRQDYATAVAIARGELSAQEAFMTGRITLGGNAGALIEAASALAAVGDALAAVRADTTY